MCSDPTLIEREAEREPKPMSKLASVGGELVLAGVALVVLVLLAVGAAIGARRRRGATIAPDG